MEAARQVYYRVTGIGYDGAPPPLALGRTRGQPWFSDRDTDRGGDRLGTFIEELRLERSRLDAIIDPVSATAYLEWTLEFRNDGPTPEEARAQIQLPPDAVV